MSTWEQGEWLQTKEDWSEKAIWECILQSVVASEEGILIHNPGQEPSRKKEQIAKGSEQGVFLEDLAAGSQCAGADEWG